MAFCFWKTKQNKNWQNWGKVQISETLLGLAEQNTIKKYIYHVDVTSSRLKSV